MKVFDYGNLPMLNVAWRINGIGGVKPSVWLVSAEDKEPIGVVVRGDVVMGSLPISLTEGVYGLKAAWLDGNERKTSEVRELFKVSSDMNEVTEDVDFDRVTLECESVVYMTTANDGLSAYELSVLRGKTELSEGDWLDDVNGVRDFTTRGLAERGRVEEEMKRVESEVLRQQEWEHRKVFIDGAINGVNEKLSRLEIMEKEVGEKLERLERLVEMYKFMVSGVDEVRNRAQSVVENVAGLSGSVEKRVNDACEGMAKRMDLRLAEREDELVRRMERRVDEGIEKTRGRMRDEVVKEMKKWMREILSKG